MNHTALDDRASAGRLLAQRLAGLPLKDPLVLAIPRGGIEVGLPIATALGAELDVVLARKLRAPFQRELAVGAVSESGEIHLDPALATSVEADPDLRSELRHQMAEIERRSALFRAVRPPAQVAGRSVIVIDDGVATGSTMIAALRSVRAQRPDELIVAVPVAAPDRLDPIRALCDRLICLMAPDRFWAVGQFYREFEEVTDERVIEVLRERWAARSGGRAG